MSTVIYHWHHIVPKHAGGTDHPSNLVKLTIQEHAEAHRLLWEQYGRLEDKMAWKLLAGQGEEGWRIGQELARQANLGDNNIMRKDAGAKQRNMIARQKWIVANKETLRNIAVTNLKLATEQNKGKRKPAHSVFMVERNKHWWKENKERIRDIMSSEWQVISPEGISYNTNRLEEWCRANGLPYTTIWKNHMSLSPIKKGRAKGWKCLVISNET